MSFLLRVVAALAVTASYVTGQSSLEGYNVDPRSVTVSGLSAGGAMAMQFHMAFSSQVSGAGVFAGLPYGCAKGGIADAFQCMTIPDFFAPVEGLIQYAEDGATTGAIGSLSNLQNSKVFVFHGTKDTTVHPGNGAKTEEIYAHFGAVVKSEFSFAATHGQPTDFYGAACGSSSAATQYINNCDYNGAHAMFKHLYGDSLAEPDTSTNPGGELLEFDQTEFFSGDISLDSIGYAYIPSGCKDKTKACRLHIAFHGCQQSRTTSGVGDAFATKTGYTHSAEVNNIIVLFPQVVSTSGSNPNACFDWWGYLNANYGSREGSQMQAIQKMLHRVLDCEDCSVNTTTVKPSITTTESGGPSTPAPACGSHEAVFNPFPGSCEYYTLCACGGSNILLRCAAGLYYDESIKGCNLKELVPCDFEKIETS